jgi:hypothetical protein
VEADRQFFDELDAIVENDAIGTYKHLRDHKKRITDPDDIYLEIKQREEARSLSRNEKNGRRRPFSRSSVLFVVVVLEGRLNLCSRRHRGLDTGRDGAAR